MKKALLTSLTVTVLLMLHSVPRAVAQETKSESMIADFEGSHPIATNKATHQASVLLVDDVPEGGGKSAAKTVVDHAAGAANHFGTGFGFQAVDFSGADEIRFWIRTDIESHFNFQVHSTDNGASVFRFSTADSKPGTWKQITAPVASFAKPPWVKGKVDWSHVNKWQVTAFGSGPYDGKYIILDNVFSSGQRSQREPMKPLVTSTVMAAQDGPSKEIAEQRGGPIHVLKTESSSAPKSPPEGFRSLFDGNTLNGWKAASRLPVPRYPGAPLKWRLEGDALEAAKKNTGRWTIEDGAIVGGQEPAGSGNGAYLVSEEAFGDFELIMDMKPDWKTDSGFLVRTLPGGSPGMQILVDHRPQGGIGGFYGNGIAGVHGMPFAIDAEYDKEGNPIRMITANPDGERVELSEKTRDVLKYTADVDDFLKVWRFGQWNTVKVRCEGRIPTLTTWVNGMKIAVLDMNDIQWENYDAEACAKMLGRDGHISLEVHNSHQRDWLGRSRWWPGAVVRWKNIFIRELEPKAESDHQSSVSAEPASSGHDFNRNIRPILSGKCFKCHGPDSEAREADLRLDQREDAIDLEAIVPGAPDKSTLIERIMSSDADLRMPPGGQPLSATEINAFRDWIKAGANYEQHWAYVKPASPGTGTLDRRNGRATVSNLPFPQTNPIDHFIQARLDEKGLQPSPPAEPAVLLRRLSLDLVGLPPTLQEVAAFENDPTEENYEASVDRLLDSRHFGEKWAAGWLDLARYADSNGYQHDDLRTMWPYRDWVIKALNDDMPFDKFTIEQLAGDLLPDPSTSQLVATGFHRNVPVNFSGGTKVDEVRANILHDRVSTTGQVWLGMTMECCQCHDHKFDPILQSDYYELYAYFNQAIPEVAQKGEKMFKKLFVGREAVVYKFEADQRRAREVAGQIAQAEKALQRAKPVALAGQAQWEKSFLASGRGRTIPWERFPWNLRGGFRMLKVPPAKRSADQNRNIEALLFYDHPATGPHEKALGHLRRERSSLAPRTMVMKDADHPVATHVFIRGDYTSHGERVEPGVPDVLHPLDPDLPPNRLGLARWIVHPDNPLTARVTVNRFWAEIFGQGIVTTLEDFGLQSAPPTHPKLLDWLALEFVRLDWSMKQIIKTIVMSATYRQTTAVPSDKIWKDRANQWLARGPRFRLSAELIRDNLLAISGKLSDKIGGPSVYPPQPAGLWKEISGAEDNIYPTSDGEDRYRRGLYTVLRRGNPNPMVLNFDGTNRSACVIRRDRSNTPVQALNLLNDPSYVEAAHALAEWIETAEGDEEKKIVIAFRRAVARRPNETEVAALRALYQKHGDWFSVAQVILNLDETITK